MSLRTKKKRPRKIPPKLYVGEWIDRLGYKRVEVAKAAKVTESYISDLSGGKRKNPGLAVFFALADFLKMPADGLRYPPPPRLEIESTKHVDPAQLVDMARRLAGLSIGATEQ
jgi:transcriptional regulator with XRE-family HTH domain